MRNQRTRLIVDVALAVALAVVLNLLALRLPVNVAGGSISLTMLPIAVVALRRGVLAGALAGTLFGILDFLMEPFILFPAQVILDYPLPYLLFGTVVGLFAGVYNRAYVRMTRRFGNVAGQPTSQRSESGQTGRVAVFSSDAQDATSPSLAKTVLTAAESGADNSPTRALAGSSVWLILALLAGGVARYLTHVLSGVLFFSEYAGEENVWIYSLVYNVSYLAPSLICSLVGALVIVPVLAQAVPVDGPSGRRLRA